jgi:hypothetical protein
VLEELVGVFDGFTYIGDGQVRQIRSCPLCFVSFVVFPYGQHRRLGMQPGGSWQCHFDKVVREQVVEF